MSSSSPFSTTEDLEASSYLGEPRSIFTFTCSSPCSVSAPGAASSSPAEPDHSPSPSSTSFKKKLENGKSIALDPLVQEVKELKHQVMTANKRADASNQRAVAANLRADAAWQRTYHEKVVELGEQVEKKEKYKKDYKKAAEDATNWYGENKALRKEADKLREDNEAKDRTIWGLQDQLGTHKASEATKGSQLSEATKALQETKRQLDTANSTIHLLDCTVTIFTETFEMLEQSEAVKSTLMVGKDECDARRALRPANKKLDFKVYGDAKAMWENKYYGGFSDAVVRIHQHEQAMESYNASDRGPESKPQKLGLVDCELQSILNELDPAVALAVKLAAPHHTQHLTARRNAFAHPQVNCDMFKALRIYKGILTEQEMNAVLGKFTTTTVARFEGRSKRTPAVYHNPTPGKPLPKVIEETKN
ncbi:ATP-dependent rRNA helicase [Pseudohyphozyma bogoriensis]|nr:ATP-dependent rRNA helicase [Pseudohyphozyma bogoriensis]